MATTEATARDRPSRRERRIHAAKGGTFAVVIALALAIASMPDAAPIARAPLQAAWILGGPLTGWYIAVSRGDLDAALSMLLVTSGMVLATILAYVFRPSSGTAGLIGLVWVLVGYILAVAIWI